MRKTITLLTILLLVVFMVGCENSINPTISDSQNLALAKSDGETMSLAKKDKCPTIQGGTIYGSDGDLITTGYNDWGYNYQAMMYNGMYCDYHPVYRPGGAEHDWCLENYENLHLMMKWNAAWISNKDCGGMYLDDPSDPSNWEWVPDGLLDRHAGFDSYIGSGAWLTNHIKGVYMFEGVEYEYSEFVKIIAVPVDAYLGLPEVIDVDGYSHLTWYNAEDVEIGREIWGAFAIIQQLIKDPSGNWGGNIKYRSPDHPGLGNW